MNRSKSLLKQIRSSNLSRFYSQDTRISQSRIQVGHQRSDADPNAHRVLDEQGHEVTQEKIFQQAFHPKTHGEEKLERMEFLLSQEKVDDSELTKYIKSGKIKDADSLMDAYQNLRNIEQSPELFQAVFQKCLEFGLLGEAVEIHEDILQTGIRRSIAMYVPLIQLAVKEGHIGRAFYFLDHMTAVEAKYVKYFAEKNKEVSLQLLQDLFTLCYSKPSRMLQLYKTSRRYFAPLFEPKAIASPHIPTDWFFEVVLPQFPGILNEVLNHVDPVYLHGFSMSDEVVFESGANQAVDVFKNQYGMENPVQEQRNLVDQHKLNAEKVAQSIFGAQDADVLRIFKTRIPTKDPIRNLRMNQVVEAAYKDFQRLYHSYSQVPRDEFLLQNIRSPHISEKDMFAAKKLKKYRSKLFAKILAQPFKRSYRNQRNRYGRFKSKLRRNLMLEYAGMNWIPVLVRKDGSSYVPTSINIHNISLENIQKAVKVKGAENVIRWWDLDKQEFVRGFRHAPQKKSLWADKA